MRNPDFRPIAQVRILPAPMGGQTLDIKETIINNPESVEVFQDCLLIVQKSGFRQYPLINLRGWVVVFAEDGD
jgi:hypothetical protein